MNSMRAFCAFAGYRYVLLNRSGAPGVVTGKVGWFHHPLDVDGDAGRGSLPAR